MTDTAAVALLFGGRSSEHSISCATAAGVLAAIDRDKYRVLPIGITHDGAFTLQPDDAARFALNAEALPEVEDNGTRVHWPESVATRELTAFERIFTGFAHDLLAQAEQNGEITLSRLSTSAEDWIASLLFAATGAKLGPAPSAEDYAQRLAAIASVFAAALAR